MNRLFETRHYRCSSRRHSQAKDDHNKTWHGAGMLTELSPPLKSDASRSEPQYHSKRQSRWNLKINKSEQNQYSVLWYCKLLLIWWIMAHRKQVMMTLFGHFCAETHTSLADTPTARLYPSAHQPRKWTKLNIQVETRQYRHLPPSSGPR